MEHGVPSTSEPLPDPQRGSPDPERRRAGSPPRVLPLLAFLHPGLNLVQRRAPESSTSWTEQARSGSLPLNVAPWETLPRQAAFSHPEAQKELFLSFPQVLGQGRTGALGGGIAKSPRRTAEEPVWLCDVWGFTAVGSHPELRPKMGSPAGRLSKGAEQAG